jgi:hypothetical protein
LVFYLLCLAIHHVLPMRLLGPEKNHLPHEKNHPLEKDHLSLEKNHLWLDRDSLLLFLETPYWGDSRLEQKDSRKLKPDFASYAFFFEKNNETG